MNQKFMSYQSLLQRNGAKLFVVGTGASLVSENHTCFEMPRM